MKQSYRYLFAIFVLAAALLSACGAGPVQGASSKVEAEVFVTGVIESMNGTQWVVNGKTLIVDPVVVHDGPFQVGDFVKAEGAFQSDGTFAVTRVELPGALAAFNDNSNNANTNEANINDDNSNDDNSNDANINGDDQSDDNSNDSFGDDNSNSDDSSQDSSGDDHGGQDGGSGHGGGDDSSNDNSNGG